MAKAKARSKQLAIPPTALILGLAGLIPFIAAGLGSLLLGNELAATSLTALGAYGAVILSFLGGVKWGVVLHDKAALKRWQPLILSVAPSIIAWVALLLPPMIMLSLLAAAMVFQYFLDTQSVQAKKLPEWYGRLRLILTTGAVVSLLMGLVALVV